MADSSAADLWALAVSGDRAAFATFYERHSGRVFAHCVHKLGSTVDAEDLTAEVFVITWSHRQRVKLHPDADILPWLLATANRLVSKHFRVAARGWRITARLSQAEPEPDPALELVERDDLDRQQRRALEALRSLSREDREIIELCVMNGLSATVIASSMGLPASTVRSRQARALVRARRAYAGSGKATKMKSQSEVIT